MFDTSEASCLDWDSIYELGQEGIDDLIRRAPEL